MDFNDFGFVNYLFKDPWNINREEILLLVVLLVERSFFVKHFFRFEIRTALRHRAHTEILCSTPRFMARFTRFMQRFEILIAMLNNHRRWFDLPRWSSGQC